MYLLFSVVFDCIEEYCPGFKASVIGRDILTPPDLERIFGLTGGVSIYISRISARRVFISTNIDFIFDKFCHDRNSFHR